MARSSSRLRHVFQFLAAFLILWAQERFSPGSKIHENAVPLKQVRHRSVPFAMYDTRENVGNNLVSPP